MSPLYKICKFKISLTILLLSFFYAVNVKANTNQDLSKIIKEHELKIQSIDNKLNTKIKELELEISELRKKKNYANPFSDVTIGGYGELHLNKGSTIDKIDFHRFVLYFNRDFTDKIQLFTELELEHSLAGHNKPGEIELEQAYVKFKLSEVTDLNIGLFLIPVGMINETHEPNLFYGSERNPIEKNIIPTTWWEAGVMANRKISPSLYYDIALHSGLSVCDNNQDCNFNIRSAREKVAKANAEAGAVTNRIRYQPSRNLMISAVLQYQQDIAQSYHNKNIDAILTNYNLSYYNDLTGLGFKALYADWNINSSSADESGQNKQYGYFLEPSYKIYLPDSNQSIGFFARYNYYDNNAGNNIATEIEQYDIGINYWPYKNIALKMDVSFLDKKNNQIDDKILNLALGFKF